MFVKFQERESTTHSAVVIIGVTYVCIRAVKLFEVSHFQFPSKADASLLERSSCIFAKNEQFIKEMPKKACLSIDFFHDALRQCSSVNFSIKSPKCVSYSS